MTSAGVLLIWTQILRLYIWTFSYFRGPYLPIDFLLYLCYYYRQDRFEMFFDIFETKFKLTIQKQTKKRL